LKEKQRTPSQIVLGLDRAAMEVDAAQIKETRTGFRAEDRAPIRQERAHDVRPTLRTKF